jgi:hypothetical protein
VKADLMRGKVFCSGCDEPRSTGITSKKGDDGVVTKYFYYRCDTPGCSLLNTSTRAKVIVNFVNAFLAQKPLSSETAYKHYAKEMKIVQEQHSKERKSLLKTLEGKDLALTQKQLRIKEFILNDKDPIFIEGFKKDFTQAENAQKETQKEIKKLKKLMADEKDTIVLMPEFLELMDKIQQIIASTDSMAELDFCIKKIFSNFFVDKKNVVSATLTEPFERLCDPKVTMGAQGGTRTRTL